MVSQDTLPFLWVTHCTHVHRPDWFCLLVTHSQLLGHGEPQALQTWWIECYTQCSELQVLSPAALPAPLSLGNTTKNGSSLTNKACVPSGFICWVSWGYLEDGCKQISLSIVIFSYFPSLCFSSLVLLTLTPHFSWSAFMAFLWRIFCWLSSLQKDRLLLGGVVPMGRGVSCFRWVQTREVSCSLFMHSSPRDPDYTFCICVSGCWEGECRHHAIQHVLCCAQLQGDISLRKLKT